MGVRAVRERGLGVRWRSRGRRSRRGSGCRCCAWRRKKERRPPEPVEPAAAAGVPAQGGGDGLCGIAVATPVAVWSCGALGPCVRKKRGRAGAPAAGTLVRWLKEEEGKRKRLLQPLLWPTATVVVAAVVDVASARRRKENKRGQREDWVFVCGKMLGCCGMSTAHVGGLPRLEAAGQGGPRGCQGSSGKPRRLHPRQKAKEENPRSRSK